MTQDIKWTNELINTMMNLLEQRYSATMIAEELSKRSGKEITRNAVAGKINRLKIGKKEKPVVVHKWSRANPMASIKIIKNDDQPLLPKSLHVYIDQLDSTADLNMCRYPGRDKNDIATYCGLPTIGGKCPWCLMHYTIVIQPLRA